MPGAHSDKTKLLGFYADLDLVRHVDAQRGAAGRSQFMREAVVEYMISKGATIPESLKRGPDRTGKGGPKKKTVYKIKRKK